MPDLPRPLSVPRPPDRTLPAWRIGIAGGLAGMLCCAGPALLALLGVVNASTAFAWATSLYGGYAWWFRLAGLAVAAALVWVALRRRNQCSVAGMRRQRRRLLAVAVAAYALLYAVATWLGTLTWTRHQARRDPDIPPITYVPGADR
jgi:hypothetical protein